MPSRGAKPISQTNSTKSDDRSHVKSASANGSARNNRGQSLGTKGDQTRQRILDAAITLLERKHLWEIRASDIAGEAKIAQSSFYTYFNSIEEVIIACARRMKGDQSCMAAQSPLCWEGEDGFQHARRLIKNAIEMWRRNAPLMRVILMLADEQNDAFVELLREIHHPIATTFIKEIERRQARGEISSSVRPELAGYYLNGFLGTVGRSSSFWVNHGADLDKIVDTAAHLLCAALNGSTSDFATMPSAVTEEPALRD